MKTASPVRPQPSAPDQSSRRPIGVTIVDLDIHADSPGYQRTPEDYRRDADTLFACEKATFAALASDPPAECRGRFVIIQGTRLVGTGNTFREANELGYTTLSDYKFLVDFIK
jgi:hypothetical protein